MTCTITFASKAQCAIADQLYAASSFEEAKQIASDYGVDGEIVFNMLLAAAIDEEVIKREEFQIVQKILNSI